jgi:hypothetical protein
LALTTSRYGEVYFRAISEYVDFAWERPWISRPLLRELLDRPPGEAGLLLEQFRPIIEEVLGILRRGAASDRPRIGPLHLIVMVSDAMNFLITASPALGSFPGAAKRQRRAQIKREVTAMVRAALGEAWEGEWE